jgi:hypothetical protein
MKTLKTIFIIARIGIPLVSAVYYLIRHWSDIQTIIDLLQNLKQ